MRALGVSTQLHGATANTKMRVPLARDFVLGVRWRPRADGSIDTGDGKVR
jgi:hypothetical protein